MAVPFDIDDPRLMLIRDELAAPATGLFTVPVCVSEDFVDLVEGFHPEVAAMMGWLAEQDLPGEYTLTSQELSNPRWYKKRITMNPTGTARTTRVYGVVFYFTHRDTAFAFKIKWG